MNFKIISDITDVQIIAVGNSIHDIARLRKMYGKGRWRKLKG
jgi:predicted HAD superfamily phosphohydrolase